MTHRSRKLGCSTEPGSPRRLTGAESFHVAGKAVDFDLLSFWRWACSDICGNRNRGLIAEYLVARAVGAADGVRAEWDAYDVLTPDGKKIEVKAAGYLQSWAQQRLSKISFDIAVKRAWDATTNTMADVASRTADIYVFAVHAHTDKESIDPLDVAQWEFHVLPTAVLNERCRRQKRITLSALLKLEPTKVGFVALGDAIRSAR